MHVGIDIPQGVSHRDDSPGLGAYLREAESHGFGSFWVTDSAGEGLLSPLETLAFAASETRTADLGVAVLISSLHSPLRLARQAATVDRLSGGRLILGVGIGNDRGDYQRHGVVVDRPVAEFERGIVVLRQLLENTQASSDQPWSLQNQARPLEPVQSPGPPIWFGARKPPALRRAARLGDGWVGAGSMSLPDFEVALQQLRGYLHEQQRGSSFGIAKRIYLHLGSRTPATLSALREWFRTQYGRAELADEVMVVGDTDSITKTLRYIGSLGLHRVILHPVLDPYNQMKALADDVLPQLAEH